MKMRCSLSQRGDEIRGVIELPANDPGFVLEGLLMMVQRFSETSGVSVYQILCDLNALNQGKVK